MAEKIDVINSDSKHIDKECINCNETFIENDEIVECPRCHQIHHVDCWKARGGCARHGCPQAAKNVVDPPSDGDGLPPPVSRKIIFSGIGIVLAIILTSVLWPEAPDPAAGRSKIYVLVEASWEEQEKLNEIVATFNEVSEDTYIELQTTTASAIETQIVTRMIAGDAPDIFSLPYYQFEAMQQEVGAMYQLGDKDNPAYGVQHPSQFRVLSIFVYTDYPEKTLEVFEYLLTEMPRIDLTEQKRQNRIIDPEFMLDIDEFLKPVS